MTHDILNTLEKLRIDDITTLLDKVPSESTEVYFYPLIDSAKNSLEKTLRIAVSLGGWSNEENIKIRKIANKELSDWIITNLNSIDNNFIHNFQETEIKDMENIIQLTTNLLRIQFFFWRWLIYLVEKYKADIKPFIKFILTDGNLYKSEVLFINQKY